MSTIYCSIPPSMQLPLTSLHQTQAPTAYDPAFRDSSRLLGHSDKLIDGASNERRPPHASQTRLPTPPSDMYGPGVSRRGSYQDSNGYQTYTERQPPAVIQYSYPTTAPPNSFYPYSNGEPLSSGRVASSTPQQQHAGYVDPQHTRSRSSKQDSIAPQLQIPRSINISQGSLPELAAQITCLLWFETSNTLQQAEEAAHLPLSLMPLAKDAIPSLGFRKWVTTILSTTQVAQHVILLALLFIYRLKKLNPTVKGKPGSEYRLLTVALMLGNKFLDDNTYTNKTWAEVSGISVTEVHVMEVEFLSNMRYSLFTTEEQWKDWHSKLGKFAEYIDKASRCLLDSQRKLPGPATPTVVAPNSTFPSPPGSNHTSPPYHGNISPYVHAQGSVLQTHEPLPELDLRNSRKRSIDEQLIEPPAKRVARNAPAYSQQAYSATTPTAATGTPSTAGTTTPSRTKPLLNYPGSSAPPRLPLPTPQSSLPVSGIPLHGQLRSSAQLPPLPESSKAMSTVFPTPVSWSQPSSSPSVLGPLMRPQLHAQTQLLDRVQRQSPFPTASAGGSPTNISYPTTPAGATPPNHSSPSYFLFQRSSPYRPVRQVNTLLQNPPSGACHTLPSIPVDRMHYRPLGRPMDDHRVGALPYLPFETFDPHQHNPWPVLPQPQAAYQ